LVAKIITGKTIGGVIRYNEQKVKNGHAKLVLMGGFALTNLTLVEKIRSFEQLQKLNERTKTNTVHISLNFSPKDKLDEFTLQKIVSDYLIGIGFEDQPYLLYQHFDAAHPHVHIVTTNISSKGKRIETHNLGRILSENVRKKIERQYSLVKAEDQRKLKVNLLQPLEKASYGARETKAAISNIVSEVIRTYQFTSLPELNAVLGQFNVGAFRGEPDSEMFKNRGLVYSVLDPEGNRIGVPIKSSSIYSKPTLLNLELHFVRNKERRKTSRDDVHEAVLVALGSSKSLEELASRLRSKGIRPVFRINAEGRLYGVTYVDNVSRTVFNGSALGKSLSANALSAQFSKEAPNLSTGSHTESIGSKDVGVQLPDIEISLNSNQPEDPTPYELRQKKKRKRRKLHL
tara:strand:+ start:150485 stop:151690 length:1206 start_codon:yes stop_codon:yes gene_type:complete